jgi:hypothetical protein
MWFVCNALKISPVFNAIKHCPNTGDDIALNTSILLKELKMQ